MGTLLLRGGARVLPVPRILGVEVASIRVAGQRTRVYRPFAPMIDDRTAADATLDEIDHPIWNNRFNRAGWTAYLGEGAGGADVPPYAAAARTEDVSALPPTYLAVGDIELFFPEVRDYARRLTAAGVPTTLDVVPGGPHGFESWARDTEPARALLSHARAWLQEVISTPA